MSENFINLDVKWINVFQNGDMYTPPIKFVVYRKHLRNFDVFLNSLTQRLKPRFGAIRNLYTPTHGRKISSLDDLEPNQNYVAAGTEKFRRVRYGNIHVLAHPTRSSQYRPYSLVEIQPVVHSAIKVASRYKTAIKNSAALTIFVYRNGDDISPPKVVPLVKKDLRNWDVVLKRVSDKIQPFSTCHLRRLCNLNGSIVHQMTELHNGEYYVAVIGCENFKCVSYGMLNPPVSRKFTNWSLADFTSPNRRLKNYSNLSSISHKYGDNKRQFFRKNRLYQRKQSQTLNKTNSLPLIQRRTVNEHNENATNSAPQGPEKTNNVFVRLYQPPSEVKFPLVDFKTNLQTKHLQPLNEKYQFNSGRSRVANKNSKMTPTGSIKNFQSDLRKQKKMIADNKIIVVGENKLKKQKSQTESIYKSKHDENELKEQKINAERRNLSQSDLKKSKNNIAGDKDDNNKSNLKSQKNETKKSTENLLKQSGNETKQPKKGWLGKSKSQPSISYHAKSTSETEDQLRDKPFVVLSVIERINPFRKVMNKVKSKSTNNEETNTKDADTVAKQKTNIEDKKTKANNAKDSKNEAKTNNNKSIKEQGKSGINVNSAKNNRQLFGGYQPHKITKEKIKLRNDILDEKSRSSFSLKDDDQLQTHVNLENSANFPLWQSDYFFKKEEDDRKRSLAQAVSYKPPTKPNKQRHRAGYDSGRTRSTVLNVREKSRLNASKTGQTFSTSNAKIKEVDYDEDNSGVYRAKIRKDSQAQIITENENTIIDLPLDDVDAEEIKDEEIIPLTRKPARELHPNIHDEDYEMDATHPTVQVLIDNQDYGSNNKNRCSPKEQRDVWSNEMRKLKDKILSKIHSASGEESSLSTKLELDSEPFPSSSETTSRQQPLQCETHRMPIKNQQNERVETVKAKSKSKLRKPRIFTNKSTSSCASDATTYTVDSSSSSDNTRNKSSTDETTDSSKLAVVRKLRHKQKVLTKRMSPIDSSPISSTQSNDPFFGESTPNDSFMNDSSPSGLNSYRDLFGKNYVIEKDSLEDILSVQRNSSEKNEDNVFVEIPSGNNDFPNFNSFKPAMPLQCSKDKLTDMQSINGCKNSLSSNGITNFGFQAECYTIDVEDGRQLIFFQDEIDLDSLK